MKNILVTGGHGFIGHHVVQELEHRGYSPAVLDRHDFKGASADTIHFGDIKDATLVTEAVAHVDGVIHLAGVLGTQETIENPRPAAETNILGGLNVIEACAQYDVPLINIAVGNYWMNNTYSITKNSVERFVEMTAKYRGKVMHSVRALNAYGPRQVPVPPWGSSRVRKIMPSFVCKALTGEPIEVYGDGSQVMDMIYVTDVARVLVNALEHLEADGSIDGPVEAGTGRDTTVLQIAETVVEEVGRLTGKGATIQHLPMRPGEDEHSVVKADESTLRKVGIDPDKLLTLENGVAVTVAYFRDMLRDR